MNIGRTAAVLGVLSAAAGIAAILRTLLMAGFLLTGGVGAEGVRLGYSIINGVATLAVTAVLFIGAIQVDRRRPDGRTLLIAGSLAMVVLTIVDVVVWIAYDDLTIWSNTGAIGAPRLAWLLLAVATLVFALLPATKQWCQATASSDARSPVGMTVAVGAALALLPAGYHVWRGLRQYDFSWAYVADTRWLDLTPGSVLNLVMLETVLMSAAIALTLMVGVLLTLFRIRIGRWLVVLGCALSLAQAVFGWTDLATMFGEFGAADLLTIFAPRTVTVAALTAVVPVVVIALMLSRRSRASAAESGYASA